MTIEDPLTLAVIVTGVVVACAIVIYSVRRSGSKERKETAEDRNTQLEGLPFKVVKSVPKEEASSAKDELRTLDLEREILSDAIRRLYEAQAEGKITEQEREKLAQTYKTRMMTIKEAITHDESLVALHELETMQEDLMKLFSDRFTELTSKIDGLRSKVEIEPVKETAIPTEDTQQTKIEEQEEKSANEEEKTKRKRKPPAKPTPRSEAERRIEEIRAEVEKVLDRLGQMEVES